MTRIEICASDDEAALAGLALAIEELGGAAADGGPMVPGTGLNRYRFPAGEELTVFMDAWVADLAGPDKLVNDVLAAMAGR